MSKKKHSSEAERNPIQNQSIPKVEVKTETQSTRKLLLNGGTVVVVALVVYILTLAPGVMYTDSGELAGACYFFGVAHPTGYPLFVILGHLWTLVAKPLGVIYAMNLFAAVCTAISSGMVYAILHTILDFISTQSSQQKKQTTSNRNTSLIKWCSIAGGLSYAFAHTVWEQATSIEVYSLHLLMMSSTILFFVRGIISNSQKTLMLSALLLGLSFTNHLTTILLIPPILLLFFWRTGESFASKNITSRERLTQFGLLLLLIISCSSVYGIMIWRSSSEAWFNWGAVHRGWEQFSYHVLGKQYQIWMFSDEPGAVKKQFLQFISLVPKNLAYIGLVLLPFAGLPALWHTSKQLFWFIVVGIFFCVGYSVNYNIHDIDSYFLLAFLLMIVASFVGFYSILQSSLASKLSDSIKPVIALSIALISLGVNYQANDKSKHTLVEEYVKLMVDPLPKNAVLISQQWDFFVSAFWYMQQVEGYRPDITIIEKEILRRTWYPAQMQRWYPNAITQCQKEIDDYMTDLILFEKDSKSFMEEPANSQRIQQKFVTMLNAFVDKNIQTRPVFVTQEIFNGENGFAESYKKTPYGLCFAITKDTLPLLIKPQQLSITKLQSSSKRYNDEHLDKPLVDNVAVSLLNNGKLLRAYGKREDAIELYKNVLLLDPKNYSANDELGQMLGK
jgi:tetratricopeptide (TPR) repeat protein